MFDLKTWKFLAPEGAGTGTVEAPASESTAAPTSDSAAPEMSFSERVSKLSPVEYKDWEMKGVLPKDDSSSDKSSEENADSADSATATEKETADTADGSAPSTKTADTGAASAAADTQKGKKTAEDSEKRWKELSEDRGRLQRENEDLKRQIGTRPPVASDKPNSQPAATAAGEEKEPGIDDIDAETGKAKFKTVEEYTKALIAHSQKQGEARAAKAERQRAFEAQNKQINDSFMERVGEVRKSHEDYDAVAFSEKLKVPVGSVLEAVVLLSPHGPEILYDLGKDVAEAERINKLPPHEQGREMFALELTHDHTLLKKIAEKAGFTLSSSARHVTQAPPPPRQTDARGTAPADEALAALSRGDGRGYMEAMNRQELASRRGN